MTIDRNAASDDAFSRDAALRDLLGAPDAGQHSSLWQVLDLLDAEVHHTSVLPDRQRRIDTVFARVMAQRDSDRVARLSPPAYENAQALSAHDEAAVDAWITGSAAQDDVRLERVDRLLALLDVPAAEQPQLANATLKRIQHDLDSRSATLRLTPERAEEAFVARRPFRLSDLGAIAAVLLVGAAVLFPMLTSLRSAAWRDVNASNLQRAGFAASLFATDHDGLVPHAPRDVQPAGLGGAGPWWQVGRPEVSHSANLFSLISGNYLDPETLNSPGNPDAPHSRHGFDVAARDWESPEQVSYSYQLFGNVPPRLADLAGRVLLADRSPVVEQSRRGQPIDPLANSSNHRGLGQHILLGDGSILFLTSPELPWGDNLWLPRHLEPRSSRTRSLTGYELPRSTTDAFVGP